MKKIPLITGAQADALDARVIRYPFRCMFGIHRKVWFFWPTHGKYRISQHITCIRCGSLLDILLLSDEAGTSADPTKVSKP